ncbi:sensor histidine kinase [Clostridium oryzae]|uniref:histidine kinase n=1 Tax=Clostridium oryzae TaxID=1450648 RepID=A0A1V4IFK2_9CLOT|nr:sensor histidine kinase [Clostridium oryzae]OPJ58297.1 sensor histidine kinase GraS [Clostridium oryzae]
MSIRIYVKNLGLTIYCFLCIFFVVNIVLISSKPIGSTFYDLAYMDFLIIAISLLFFAVGYRRWSYTYRGIYRAIENGEDISLNMPDTMYYSEVELIKNILDVKDKEMEDRFQKVKEASDEVNDYIIKWVHEIKMPIAVCELIAEKMDEIGIAEELRMEIDRIKFLINQVLYMSRAASFSEDFQVEQVNVEKLVKGIIKRNVSFFISKDIELQLENVNFYVITDQKWSSYIIDQLINNSCKYVNKGGIIRIYAEEDEKAVKLHVIDNGVGIKQQDIRRIFDKGFTGSNGRGVSKSTGMGLYLSQKIAMKLGHKILVQSSEDKGTEFIIWFYKLSL